MTVSPRFPQVAGSPVGFLAKITNAIGQNAVGNDFYPTCEGQRQVLVAAHFSFIVAFTGHILPAIKNQRYMFIAQGFQGSERVPGVHRNILLLASLPSPSFYR